jgi:hypothetical protein
MQAITIQNELQKQLSLNPLSLVVDIKVALGTYLGLSIPSKFLMFASDLSKPSMVIEPTRKLNQ